MDSILTGLVVFLVLMNLAVMIAAGWFIHKLINKIMSRNFYEYAQASGELRKAKPEATVPREIKLPDPADRSQEDQLDALIKTVMPF